MRKLLLLTLTAFFTIHAFSQNKNLIIKTENGRIEGVLEPSGVRSFKGIPFAAPPVGELRWREPQSVKNWKGIRKADHFGPRAMQPPIFSDMVFRSDGMSEDCLYLNVWAPSNTGNGKLPVLVYFYGGGFIAGDGSEPRYDGESMAQKGIVALTVNYRLGIFGLFSHPELTKESSHHASGNYGLMDQSAAIQWVKRNIAAFGGDPNKITIAGESAGSISVSAQMASPLSRNLIAGAIGESGSVLGALPPVPLATGEQNGEKFATSIGANSLAALRSIPADSLIKAVSRSNPFRFSMTIDGYFFPKDPLVIFQSGEQAHVPLLAGWNSEEGNYRGILGNQKLTKENFEAAIRKLYPDHATEILSVYQPATDADVERVSNELASDRFIAFSTWRWIDLQAKTGGKPVYRYYYMRARPAMAPGMGNAPAATGAVHSAEIEYAMGNLHYNKVYSWTPEDEAVSKILQEYFANFIKKGDPNGPGLPNWPSIHGNQIPVMQIDVHSRLTQSSTEQRYHVVEQISKK